MDCQTGRCLEETWSQMVPLMKEVQREDHCHLQDDTKFKTQTKLRINLIAYIPNQNLKYRKGHPITNVKICFYQAVLFISYN